MRTLSTQKISPTDPLATFSPAAAWASLKPLQRDMIGALAIRYVFAGFASEADFDEADRILGDRINREAHEAECAAIGAIIRSVQDALPAVFGQNGEDPDWMLGRRAERELSDSEIVQLAVRGLRGAFAPASMLVEA